MTYQELKAISRAEAQEALSYADESETVVLILRLANTAGEWEWKQDFLLASSHSPSAEIRRACVQGLGDLARIHRQLDVVQVKATFEGLWRHPELRGTIEDALSDIEIFVPSA
ncbi:hypothetical protein [Deinococcus sp.]|uniref:hypothetical protein n=1 Tax=Deinococcus sp. TaxID=47478 RepID=UPI003CC5C11B